MKKPTATKDCNAGLIFFSTFDRRQGTSPQATKP
jgi:hypothetical protein